MTRGGKQRGTHPKMRNLETHATSTQAQRTKTRRGLCSLECHQSQMYSCCRERAGLRTPSHLRRPHKEILCVIHLAIEHSRLRQFSLTQLRRSPHSFTYTQSRVELVWHLLMHDLAIQSFRRTCNNVPFSSLADTAQRREMQQGMAGWAAALREL